MRRFFLAYLLFGSLLFLSATPAMNVPSTRTNAMGGPHIALGDDLSVLLVNPAGYYSAEAEMSLSELNLWLKGPVFDIANIAIEGMGGELTDLLSSSSVQTLLSDIYAGVNFSGPIAFSYIGNGLGFGIFNTTDVEVTNSGPLTIDVHGIEEVLLCGGYTFRIPFPEDWPVKLDLGLLLKGSLAGELSLNKSLLELPAYFESISMDTMLTLPFRLTSSIGIDTGLRLELWDVLSFGIAATDLFTPSLINDYSSLQAFLDNEAASATNENRPLNLSAGLLWTPNLGALSNIFSDFKLTLDYTDILDFITHPATATNPLLHIGVGTEMKLLSILSVQGGFYQGLFNAGVGLDLRFFTLSVAMFGRELGTEPGIRPVYNMQLAFEFRI